MAERYWVTGVQLALINILCQSVTPEGKICKKDVQKILKKIESRQFIGSYPDEKDKKRFLKQIKAMK